VNEDDVSSTYPRSWGLR